jgi:hypothetical protein
MQPPWNDNLTKVIMEALMIGDGLPSNQIVMKFILFSVSSVNVCEGINIDVTKQIHGNYVLHPIRVHCINVQTLSILLLVICFRNLL